MGVVRLQINTRMPDGHAPIVVLRRVVNQSFSDRPRVMPHDSARPRIEREGIIRLGDEHHSVHDDGGDLEHV